MKKYKVLKKVINGPGINPEDEHFEDRENRVHYELFTKRPFRGWRATCSTGNLESMAQKLSWAYLGTKKNWKGEHSPFKTSDMDISFSLGRTRWGDGYGFYFADTRELTYEERDELVRHVGKNIRDSLKKRTEK